MNITEFVAMPAIVVVVYLVAYFCKVLFKSETFNRLIPPICGVLGGVLGIVCFMTLPEYIPAENWLAALATGIVSGWAATGVNQVYKQLTKSEAAVEVTDDADGEH